MALARRQLESVELPSGLELIADFVRRPMAIPFESMSLRGYQTGSSEDTML